MPRRGRKRKPGRPSLDLAETAYLLKMPRALNELVRVAAEQDGVKLAEWWRAAAIGAILLRSQERARWEELLERQRPANEDG